MTNGLWWRYYTTPNNFNRSRAAALSQLLLCENFLGRPIRFSAPSLLESDNIGEVILENEACVGCHSTLDPLASALFGFWWYDIYDNAELSSYHAEREYLGEQYLSHSPGYFGMPMESPADLGPLLAADHRLVSCTVERMAELLLRRETGTDDFNALAAHREDFEDSGLRLSSLVLSLLSDPEYRAGSLSDEVGGDGEELYQTKRIMVPSMLDSAVEEATGFTWEQEGYRQLDNDVIGYRNLLGGVDGSVVTRASNRPSLSRQLVIKRLSQAAAAQAVESAWAEPSGLFPLALSGLAPGDAGFGETARLLHRRLHARNPSEEQLAEDEELWLAVEAQSDARQAWASLLSVMVRDPDFWMY